jgi:hypothetical protein
MNLPTGTSSGRTNVEYEKVYVLHATAPVYYPAPNGATYCNTATCTHKHSDTDAGRIATEECAARLARIIATGRLPLWATLSNPI